MAAVCRGMCGELGLHNRHYLAWVAARTPLHTILASRDGLAIGFSPTSIIEGVSNNVRGGRDPSLLSTHDQSWDGTTWPVTGLSGKVRWGVLCSVMS